MLPFSAGSFWGHWVQPRVFSDSFRPNPQRKHAGPEFPWRGLGRERRRIDQTLGETENARVPALTLCPVPSLLYGECMARLISTTVRLGEEDVRALKRARAAGLSASDLIRKSLRVVASRYYSGRRPPSTLLFESTNSKLGDESEILRDIED